MKITRCLLGAVALVCLTLSGVAQVDQLDVQNNGTSAKKWSGGSAKLNFVNGGCSFNTSTKKLDCTFGGDVSDISVSTATNPSSETQLKELALPAAALNVANRHVKYVAKGRYTTAAGQSPTLRFRVYLCTVSGCGSGTVLTLADFTTAATTAATTNSWRLEGDIGTAATGATGTLEPMFWQQVQLGAAADLTPETRLAQTNAVTSTIDLTAALYLRLTVLASTANAANTVSARLAYASLAVAGGGWSGTVSGVTYPGAGVPNSTGSAWGTSYTVGTSANNLVQFTAATKYPAVDGSLITNVDAATLGTKSFASPAAIGTGTPAAITGTTITANTQFTGSGAGLTSIPQSGIAAGNYTIGAYYIDQAEIAAPASPSAGVCREYVDSTTHIKTWKNSGGTSCGPSAGGGITNGAGSNVVMKSDATNAVASSITDDGSTVTTTEPVVAPSFTSSDTTHAGAVDLIGFAADTTIPTGAAGWSGNTSATATPYRLRMPTAENAAAGPMVFGASSSHYSQGSFYTMSGSGTVFCLATSCVMTTPNIGTPSAAVLTNATGLPAASVVAGALANGMTATSQSADDNSTKVATDAYVDGQNVIVSSGMTAGHAYYISAANTLSEAGGGISATAPAVCVAVSATICRHNGILTTTGLTAGAVYYVPTSSGVVTATAPSSTGQFVQRIGVALSTTVLIIKPSLDIGTVQ